MMKRKSSKSIRAQRPSQAPPRLSVPPPPSLEPSTEITAILTQLSPHGVSALVAFARKLRDEERLRGARPPLAVLSPRDFVARVHQAANAVTIGVLDGRVFLSAVYKVLEERGDASGLSLADFKDRLLTAHRAGLLALSRCDKIERIDNAMLAASEIRHLGSMFHLLQRVRPESS